MAEKKLTGAQMAIYATLHSRIRQKNITLEELDALEKKSSKPPLGEILFLLSAGYSSTCARTGKAH